MRSPLLHALDVEYARAAKAKDIARMAEIARIVDALHRLLDNTPPETPPEPPALAPTPRAAQMPPAAAPAFYGLPSQPQATNLRMTSLQDILTAADPAPIHIPPLPIPPQPLMPPPLPAMPGKGWRQQAKAAVLQAVSSVNARLAEGRPLYEQALMARNDKIEPLAGLKLAASIDGLTVEQKVDQIIAEYDANGRRAMFVETLKVQAFRDIDNAATGDEADAIAKRAVKDIMGEDE